MFSANQIAGFLNVKKPDFLHVDANPHKLKVYQKIFGWACSKMSIVHES